MHLQQLLFDYILMRFWQWFWFSLLSLLFWLFSLFCDYYFCHCYCQYYFFIFNALNFYYCSFIILFYIFVYYGFFFKLYQRDYISVFDGNFEQCLLPPIRMEEIVECLCKYGQNLTKPAKIEPLLTRSSHGVFVVTKFD